MRNNRLAAQRRMWLLVKSKEEELESEKEEYERKYGKRSETVSLRKNAVSRSKRRNLS